MGDRAWPRLWIGASTILTIPVAFEVPQVLFGAVPCLVLAVVMEVASTRRWGGFWGEKNPDGTSKY